MIRAAVFQGPNLPFTLEQFPAPSLQPGDALVRIRFATICGSDLHSHSGRRHSPSPSILGHEMIGELVATGPGEYPIPIGARVTWPVVWSCGHCALCRRGLRAKCESLRKFGHEALSTTREVLGGFADHCFLPAGTAVFRVPDSIPDSAAAPANCATATVAACFRRAGDVAGQRVAILGAGLLGLTACAMARQSRAASIQIVEPDSRRQALAREFGADGPLAENSPADFVFDFTGVPEAMERGFTHLATGGCFVFAGAVFPARPLALPAEQIVRRMLRFEGQHNYEPEDLARALAFLASTPYPFARLVEKSFPLSGINEAFAYAARHHPLRVAIIP
jgi:alcohol dehydrogenase